ncbi:MULTISPECIES: S8 family peptidase [unclassified Peribacillus]|uniref:S8 family peptidase n=1 Tax=unclassified Peribacillus TaxID=2675266 RepID=UPI001F4E34C1|nr:MULTISPECIES: S8 family peptidase [unclassified Peribacillus]MCK1986053.1 S8 family peptidase [Peribacillus sp. Aquil_B1]MCK2011351.1 S8 family peptidase [Peribacillus sp. Aquil_B8]
MAEHIFISGKPESHRYTAFGAPIKDNVPVRERRTHAKFLQNKLNDIWKVVNENDSARLAVSLPVRNGTYLEFMGSPDELLNIQSLENKPSGIRLLNSRIVDADNHRVIKATVYVPKGKEGFFLKRIEEYGEDTKGTPKHEKLVATINDIRGAVLESFWIGKKEWMPGENPIWCEIWIRDEAKDGNALSFVKKSIIELGIVMKREEISFPERKVILIKADRKQLTELIARNEFIAEIKRATEANSFFLDIENKEQVDWARDLLERLEQEESNVAVSILDTGINNGNILLAKIVADEDIHSYFNDSGNDLEGHGTAMGGISAYGDLKEALLSEEKMILSHSLESMKIFPDGQKNAPELFGAITAQSVSTLYIKKPERERIICMAVTAEDYMYLDGRPSSWSAAIDDLIHGTMDEVQKVFIVSAGNIRGPQKVYNYPDSSLLEAIEDPGQSWNAITVGAYTNLDAPEDSSYEVVAQSGGLSPYSRSSVLFDKIWPIKPEIVLEGGNAVKSGDGAYEDAELSVLTTHHSPVKGIFTTVNATSAATASASWLAAKIQTEYPEAWPETVRALLIHSAEWTNEMKKQFLKGTKKGDYQQLLRTCGYGVPSFERAIETANNRVNLIIQSELQPFDKLDGSYKTNEMHIHELPWPKEELLNMLDAEVEMKVTLSYYIEPGPGEKGWKDKYRYASSGLRFDLNGTSDKESFLKRINKAAVAEDEKGGGSSSIGWKLGPGNRDVGSIHSDTWIGPAANLATSNYIGIYPVIGWWRERPHLGKWDHKIRYSLVVSLSTPETQVDLLTPIQNQIAAQIATEVKPEIKI